MRPRDHKLELLRALPAFATCRPAEVQLLCRHFELASVESGIVLAEEGQPVKHLYVVLHGHLRLERMGQAVATLGDGDPLGVADLLDGGHHRVTALTEGRASLLVAGIRAFRALVDDSEAFRRLVLVGLARQARPETTRPRLPWAGSWRPATSPCPN